MANVMLGFAREEQDPTQIALGMLDLTEEKIELQIHVRPGDARSRGPIRQLPEQHDLIVQREIDRSKIVESDRLGKSLNEQHVRPAVRGELSRVRRGRIAHFVSGVVV